MTNHSRTTLFSVPNATSKDFPDTRATSGKMCSCCQPCGEDKDGRLARDTELDLAVSRLAH